jgi:hypothetical protein
VNDLGVRLSGTRPLGNPVPPTVPKPGSIRSSADQFCFSRNTDLTVLADVGGFGVASDITVQA